MSRLEQESVALTQLEDAVWKLLELEVHADEIRGAVDDAIMEATE